MKLNPRRDCPEANIVICSTNPVSDRISGLSFVSVGMKGKRPFFWKQWVLMMKYIKACGPRIPDFILPCFFVPDPCTLGPLNFLQFYWDSTSALGYSTCPV